jgi:hypothetical protein
MQVVELSQKTVGIWPMEAAIMVILTFSYPIPVKTVDAGL